MRKLLAKTSFVCLLLGWLFSGLFPFSQKLKFLHLISTVNADTATKTWTFDSDTESWAFTYPAGANNTTDSWQSADASPSNGSLQLRISGKNKTNTDRRRDISGTWESLFGIPANSTVTEVGSGTGNSYYWRVSEYATGAAGTVGPFTFRDSSETLIGTFSSGTSFSATSNWAQKTGTAVSVPANLQASSSTVLFRISNDLATGNNNNAAVTVRHDTVSLTITYTPPPAVSISLSTDGAVAFGYQAPNTTQDTTSSGLNDPETVSVDTGPANLDVRSTTFSDGSVTWTLNTANGADQVLWEFSNNDGTGWTTFAAADTLYTFDTNVSQGATRNLSLRLTTPTSTASLSQQSTTVTIVASTP